MSSAQAYVHKPIEVDAMQFEGTDEDLIAVYSWIMMSGNEKNAAIWDDKTSVKDRKLGFVQMSPTLTVQYVRLGDFVVRKYDGSFMIVDPVKFHLDYQKVQL